MKKRCIAILDCEVGEIIAQKVVSKYGTTIVVENTTINSYIKNKLIAFKADYIWIYGIGKGESIKFKDDHLKQLKQSYQKNVLEIKELLNNLAKGTNVSIEKINQISNSIYEPINNEYHVVQCLNELKSVDKNTFTHSINVSLYAMLLGKWLLLPESKIINLIQAALLHDVGKTKISNSILNKKGKLEFEEFEEMKNHPIYSFEIVKDIDGLSMESKEAILMHHERENKSGYPRGVAGSEMNICSKIIAFTNYYDSITSEKTYRKKINPFDSFQLIQSQIITSFDMHIVNTFLSNIAACYIGSKVLLSNGQTGEIVYVPPKAITRPIICINSEYKDLSKEIDLNIVSML
ncbi:HD-GYP domain-containing protein [Clostridium tagluense]|uniref:HD-GYP domain-containing protein n=1 Tax=Clostridium tagluense TaxID=360422 RepID=UPI001CF5808E|nr:HD-GYP domain-containing protein [Clostridium tagluense]MCB2298528.1 HD-GYP domain-containing protein [Clostridium tagluense]